MLLGDFTKYSWPLLMALTACVTVDVDAVREMEIRGPRINAALHFEYMKLAEAELTKGDQFSASFFAYKARAAARDEPSGPENLTDWDLPTDSLEALVVARARLITALAEVGRSTAPEMAARTQAMFDCWLEAQEENARPSDIETCRTEFRIALVELEAAVATR